MKAKKKKARRRAVKSTSAVPFTRQAHAPLQVEGMGKIQAPGYDTPKPGPSWIKPGRYVMRNRSVAIVTGPTSIRFGIGHRHTWNGWKGHLEGDPHGEGLNWSLDGKRSDAAPLHEHDLLKRHKNQEVKK